MSIDERTQDILAGNYAFTPTPWDFRSTDLYYVDGALGSDDDADGTTIKKFKSPKKLLDLLGHPVDADDYKRPIGIMLAPGIYDCPDLKFYHRNYTLFGKGVTLNLSLVSNLCTREIRNSKEFGVSDGYSRPSINFIGLGEEIDVLDSNLNARGGIMLTGDWISDDHPDETETALCTVYAKNTQFALEYINQSDIGGSYSVETITLNNASITTANGSRTIKIKMNNRSLIGAADIAELPELDSSYISDDLTVHDIDGSLWRNILDVHNVVATNLGTLYIDFNTYYYLKNWLNPSYTIDYITNAEALPTLYDPTTVGDWPDVPENVRDALDYLATRVTALEGA